MIFVDHFMVVGSNRTQRFIMSTLLQKKNQTTFFGSTIVKISILYKSLVIEPHHIIYFMYIKTVKYVAIYRDVIKTVCRVY